MKRKEKTNESSSISEAFKLSLMSKTGADILYKKNWLKYFLMQLKFFFPFLFSIICQLTVSKKKLTLNLFIFQKVSQ